MPGFRELCDQLQTDKGRYASFYESLSDEWRNSVKKILEIGLQGGSSLRLWEKFFPNASIYGIDHDPGRIRDKNPAWVLGAMSQEHIPLVQAFAKTHGPWDVVVDDADHIPEHGLMSYVVLRPHSRVYIIEDVKPQHVCLWPTDHVRHDYGHENVLVYGSGYAFN